MSEKLSALETCVSFVNIFKLIRPRLEERVFHVTGNNPLTEYEMSLLIAGFGGQVYYPTFFEDSRFFLDAVGYMSQLDYVIIGTEEFDERFLEVSLSYGYARGTEYWSQEAFFEFLIHNTAPGYVQGDLRILEHPGLSYLSSIGFEWPSTYAEPGNSDVETTDVGWATISELKELGYTVRQGTPVSQRWDALAECVRRFGLKHVAYKVAWFVRVRKVRRDDIMVAAIERYQEDLSWLKATYYDNSSYGHKWPWPKIQ